MISVPAGGTLVLDAGWYALTFATYPPVPAPGPGAEMNVQAALSARVLVDALQDGRPRRPQYASQAYLAAPCREVSCPTRECGLACLRVAARQLRTQRAQRRQRQVAEDAVPVAGILVGRRLTFAQLTAVGHEGAARAARVKAAAAGRI